MKRSLVGAVSNDPDASDSLVSLRTGVHRKDVKRLRAGGAQGTSKKIPISGLAMVITTWCQDDPFRDVNGLGNLLPRRGTDTEPGFDTLVRASKVDLAPATVLRELVEQGLARMHDDDRVELLSSTFIPRGGQAALDAFEATIADHIRIATENVLAEPGEPRQFDQVLRYSHLSADSVQKLEHEARKLAREYLERLNALAHRLQSEDDASGRLQNGRFVTGVYVAPTPPETDAPQSAQKKDRD
ncbi:MAG: DUF6502 family protein [Paracoccaceae bacterium]